VIGREGEICHGIHGRARKRREVGGTVSPVAWPEIVGAWKAGAHREDAKSGKGIGAAGDFPTDGRGLEGIGSTKSHEGGHGCGR